MKTYEELQMEVIEFENADVITESENKDITTPWQP